MAREAETNRSNIAKETETSRHNIVFEKETERHNIATEKNQNLSVQAQLSQAATAAKQVELGYANLNEASRHNLAVEQETHRSNVTQESVKFLTVDNERKRIDEMIRHNLQMEGYNDAQIEQASKRLTYDYVSLGVRTATDLLREILRGTILKGKGDKQDGKK